MQSLPKKNDITKDQWVMFYEFVKLVGGDINKYEDDGKLFRFIL